LGRSRSLYPGTPHYAKLLATSRSADPCSAPGARPGAARSSRGSPAERQGRWERLAAVFGRSVMRQPALGAARPALEPSACSLGRAGPCPSRREARATEATPRFPWKSTRSRRRLWVIVPDSAYSAGPADRTIRDLPAGQAATAGGDDRAVYRRDRPGIRRRVRVTVLRAASGTSIRTSSTPPAITARPSAVSMSVWYSVASRSLDYHSGRSKDDGRAADRGAGSVLRRTLHYRLSQTCVTVRP
jgi:hypothetical protein